MDKRKRIIMAPFCWNLLRLTPSSLPMRRRPPSLRLGPWLALFLFTFFYWRAKGTPVFFTKRDHIRRRLINFLIFSTVPPPIVIHLKQVRRVSA